jgi:VanZ family protein
MPPQCRDIPMLPATLTPSISQHGEGTRTDRKVCVCAAITVAALIMYGSLVPFDLKTLGTFNLIVGVERIPFAPWSQVSRTDVLVNVAVGVALGFFLTGAWRSTWGHRRVAAALGVLVATCVSTLLAVGLEVLQVFSPTRDSSWNDVLAQTFGAILGSLAWAVTGRKVVAWMRHLSEEPELFRRAVRLLHLYVPIYLLLQLTPFDISRVAKLAAKYAGSGVTSIPSVSQFEFPFLVLDWIGNALLNVPIGMLAAIGWIREGQRRGSGWAFVLGVSVIVSVSIAQVFLGIGAVHVGGIVAAAFGVAVGIALGRQFLSHRRGEPRDRSGVARICVLLATAAWLLLLVGQAWYPFDFELTSEIVERRLNRVSLVPFVFYYWYASYTLSPLQAIHETLLHFVMAVPLGLLPRLAWRISSDHRIRQLQTVAITLAATSVLIGIEFGQMFLPTRFPDVTDVLIGVTGTIVGERIGRAFAPRWEATDRRIRRPATSAARRCSARSTAQQTPHASTTDAQHQHGRAAANSTARS